MAFSTSNNGGLSARDIQAIQDYLAKQTAPTPNTSNSVPLEGVLPDQVEFVPPSALRKQMRVMEKMIVEMGAKIDRLEYELRRSNGSIQPSPGHFTWTSGPNYTNTPGQSLGSQSLTAPQAVNLANSALQNNGILYQPPPKKKKHGLF